MGKSWLKTTLLYVVTIAVVAALGVWLGSMLGKRRAEASRESNQAALQEYLEQNLIGIDVGKMFPDVPVWSPDGTQAYGIHELLPHGGVLVYVASGCSSCFDALRALKEAQTGAGVRGRDVLVILGGNPDSLAAGLAERGIEMPFYHDAQQSFATQYKIGIFPSSFVLADGGVLVDMVAGTHSREQFDKVLVP